MNSRKKRIQLDFTEEAAERLDELVRLNGAVSRAEVVRRALKLFDMAQQSADSGGELILRLPDGSEQKIVLV